MASPSSPASFHPNACSRSGSIRTGANRHEGKGFEQLKAYTTNQGRVSAIIQIPALKEETYGRDLADMLQERRTFDEALADPALTIMTRQRLKIVKTQLFAQLENAAVL